MPYEGEYAHYQPLKRIVESERVQQLLRRFRVLDQANLPQQAVPKTPPAADAALPSLVLAIDGSHAEVDVRNGYPGAKIGYCSVASVVLNLAEVDRLDASRPISPIDFRRTEEPSSDASAFPPDYLPHRQDTLFQTPEGEIVTARITVGLRSNRNDEDDYGVYFYCNERLIQAAVKDHAVGYFSGAAGKPHFDASLVRSIVEFSGSARQMPWNTSKTSIQYHHKTFKHIEKWLHNSLKKFTQVSRALRENWDEAVFAYQQGKIIEAAPSFDEVPLKTFTLARPETRKSYEQRMIETNEELAEQKPWTTGLYEGVVATHILLKSLLKERNRIALIVLDSTLEIAFKDFLANETANSISDDRLLQLAKDRRQLVDEVAKQNPSLIDQVQRQQLDYFYRLRCKLVHERSNAGINPDDLEKYRHLVQKLLNKMFGIRFVESTGK